MKALVGAFNQEKALVGAFSVIVKTDCETDGSFYSTTPDRPHPGGALLAPLLVPGRIPLRRLSRGLAGQNQTQEEGKVIF